MNTYKETLLSTPAGSYSDDEFLRNIPKFTGTAEQNDLAAKTSRIALESDSFNATQFFEAASYVQLTDPTLPGPEFDLPRELLLRARPKQLQRRKAWETIYEIFRQQRMNICGLDLEPYPVEAFEGREIFVDPEQSKAKEEQSQKIV